MTTKTKMTKFQPMTKIPTKSLVLVIIQVKKIMSIKDLNNLPIAWSTDSCLNTAALVYTSNMAPTDKWYSCLDCQV